MAGKVGRPKKAARDRRSVIVVVRLTRHERDLATAAARSVNVKRSQFLRDAIIETAKLFLDDAIYPQEKP